MHWADVIAERLIEEEKKHIIATGITPSGHIHVGNMREILTGDLIHRALLERGGNSTLLYVGDSFDPLRKVYPFLDRRYQRYVGMPLSEVPCPCGKHESYAHHFLQPFLESLERLGVNQKTVLTHELYRNGSYAESIKRVLEHREEIRDILERVSGRKLPLSWFPYIPKCEACGRFGAQVIDYSYPFVEYRCECGYEGKADLRKDDGKLPWRVDWPARWWFLGVTCEPFGKDHGAAGGSYATGKVIVQEIFGRSPPEPVMYEWIHLKGKGAMSSSTGVVVTGVEMLKMTPPEVLRFLIAKQNPSRHIDFDPGLGILSLVDEYDRYERIYFGKESAPDVEDMKRTYELSEPLGKAAIPQKMPFQVPYRHLVTLVQLTDDLEELKARIKRTMGLTEFPKEAEERLRERVECVRYWLEGFAPEGVKFTLCSEMPEFYPSAKEREFLRRLYDILSSVPWDAEAVHKSIYDAAGELGVKKGFRLLYRLFLNTSRGPRLGFFLSSLERDFVLNRIMEGILHEK